LSIIVNALGTSGILLTRTSAEGCEIGGTADCVLYKDARGNRAEPASVSAFERKSFA
jgi:hypothetical protein